jgi:hypothetical protein
MRLGIVSTVHEPGVMLDSFIQYHRAIGFQHFLLFFDNPQDPDIRRAQRYPEVTVVPCDEAHGRALQTLQAYPVFGPQCATFHSARQILNAEMGMRMAADMGLDWLLHIDADELFHSPVLSPADHFTQLQESGAAQGTYLNMEAVPEALEVADPFREVTLFKRNPFVISSLFLGRYFNFWQARGHYFVGYNHGKSAAQVDRRVTTASTHRFRHADGDLATRELTSPSILHYPSCGLSRHIHKFERLGATPDEAWSGMRNRIPFFLTARNLCQNGDFEGFRRLYVDAVMMNDPAAIAEQSRIGILRRVNRPARLLAALPPPPE